MLHKDVFCAFDSKQCRILKYADDTVIIGNVVNNDESVYRTQVDDFVKWCDNNYLDLNVTKTKEMIIDFRKSQSSINTLSINDQVVDTVHSYKYLGVIIDDKLTGNDNSYEVYVKGIKRLYFLRLLKNIRVDTKILSLFYKSIIESVLCSCIVAWYGNSNQQCKNKVARITKSAGRMGVDATDLQKLYERATLKFTQKCMNDFKHPLHNYYVWLPSGKRLNVPCQRTTRYKKSFVPSSIVLFNQIRKSKI